MERRDGVNVEIIVVDNGSTDLTAEIARSFGARVIEEPRGNVAIARNAGARAANGHVLAFVDADKARYPDYYQALLPRLRAGGLLVFDNVLWSGEVLAPESDDARGIARLNDLVQSDQNVDNVMLTIRDGVLIARKC